MNIICSTSEGKRFFIEIRKSYQKHFLERLLHYVCNVFDGQIKVGKTDYRKIEKVIVIAISSVVLLSNESFLSEYRILDTKTNK